MGGSRLCRGDEAAVSLDAAKAGGIYPQEYVYRSSPVEHVLDHGDAVTVGDFGIEMIHTPGHCSYLVTGKDKTYLVGGDAIFFGRKVVLQKTYDCSVPQTIESIERLSEYSFEALLPGHLNFSLKNGKRHINTARAITDRFGCPPSIT